MEKPKRHWVAEIERWKASGLRKSEYCTREGINRNTFSTWWRRYKATEERRIDGSGFVEVNLAKGREKIDTPTHSYPAEIHAVGFIVRINGDADRHLIENIFKALESRLCS